MKTMQIIFSAMRECSVSPENGPAVVLSDESYQRLVTQLPDLVNDKSLNWAEWAALQEIDGCPVAVLGFEPSAFYDAGIQAVGHVLVRWCFAPAGFQFPANALIAEMRELCPSFRLNSTRQKFVLADPINLDAGPFEIGIQAPVLIVHTYEYCPTNNARFVVHVFSEGKIE